MGPGMGWNPTGATSRCMQSGIAVEADTIGNLGAATEVDTIREQLKQGAAVEF